MFLAPAVVTVVVICRVALAPAASVPTFQSPVPVLYAPWDTTGVPTIVSPAGSRSWTCTPVAVPMPAAFEFETVTV